MMQFGERLKIARMAKGLSQAKLAEILGVEPSAVSRWEKGGGIEAHRIPQIAQQLGRTVEWLQGEDNASLEDRIAQLEAKIASLESPTVKDALTNQERELIRLFRLLSPELRERHIVNLREHAESLGLLSAKSS